jgi:hypothetical protein
VIGVPPPDESLLYVGCGSSMFDGLVVCLNLVRKTKQLEAVTAPTKASSAFAKKLAIDISLNHDNL